MSRADAAHWWIEHVPVFPLQPGTKKPYANCRRCRAGACAAEADLYITPAGDAR